MKNMIRSLILVPAVVCASAAFAAETSTVSVPFSFTSHGTSYPAGSYTVAVDTNHIAVLSSATRTSKVVVGNLTPGDGNPNSPANVSLEFSSNGANHELRKIKYGAYSTANMATADRKAKTQVAQVSDQSAKGSNGR